MGFSMGPANSAYERNFVAQYNSGEIPTPIIGMRVDNFFEEDDIDGLVEVVRDMETARKAISKLDHRRTVH